MKRVKKKECLPVGYVSVVVKPNFGLLGEMCLTRKFGMREEKRFSDINLMMIACFITKANILKLSFT